MSAETIIGVDGWADVLGEPSAFVEEWRVKTVAQVQDAEGGVAVLLTDDAALRDLNKRFRGKDAPTNVLSFPDGEDNFLGDIAIALETCLKEADEKSTLPAHHAAHLIVHGLLHLIGFDHETDEDAQEMEDLERQILATGGVSDPYGEE